MAEGRSTRKRSKSMSTAAKRSLQESTKEGEPSGLSEDGKKLKAEGRRERECRSSRKKGDEDQDLAESKYVPPFSRSAKALAKQCLEDTARKKNRNPRQRSKRKTRKVVNPVKLHISQPETKVRPEICRKYNEHLIHLQGNAQNKEELSGKEPVCLRMSGGSTERKRNDERSGGEEIQIDVCAVENEPGWAAEEKKMSQNPIEEGVRDCLERLLEVIGRKSAAVFQAGVQAEHQDSSDVFRESAGIPPRAGCSLGEELAVCTVITSGQNTEKIRNPTLDKAVHMDGSFKTSIATPEIDITGATTFSSEEVKESHETEKENPLNGNEEVALILSDNTTSDICLRQVHVRADGNPAEVLERANQSCNHGNKTDMADGGNGDFSENGNRDGLGERTNGSAHCINGVEETQTNGQKVVIYQNEDTHCGKKHDNTTTIDNRESTNQNNRNKTGNMDNIAFLEVKQRQCNDGTGLKSCEELLPEQFKVGAQAKELGCGSVHDQQVPTSTTIPGGDHKKRTFVLTECTDNGFQDAGLYLDGEMTGNETELQCRTVHETNPAGTHTKTTSPTVNSLPQNCQVIKAQLDMRERGEGLDVTERKSDARPDNGIKVLECDLGSFLDVDCVMECTDSQLVHVDEAAFGATVDNAASEMEVQGTPDAPEAEATEMCDMIRGLTAELSSLNKYLMGAWKEVENIRKQRQTRLKTAKSRRPKP